MHVNDCLIDCQFTDGRIGGQYIGTMTELYANIVTTWSKVPHYVRGSDVSMEVFANEGKRRLAVFTITPLDRWPRLPGHF